VDGGEMLEEERLGEGEVPEEDNGRRRGDGVRKSGRRRDKRCCWRKRDRMKEKCLRYWKIES
jgi:hypothetical protein